MLHTAVAADQAVIAVAAAIGHVRWTRSGHIVVKGSIRAVVAIGVISAIRSVVGILAGTVAGTPGVIAVVVGGVPGVVRDVGVMVEDDRVATAASAPTSPVAGPGMKAPAEAAAYCPASATEGDADAETENRCGKNHGEACTSARQWVRRR